MKDYEGYAITGYPLKRLRHVIQQFTADFVMVFVTALFRSMKVLYKQGQRALSDRLFTGI